MQADRVPDRNNTEGQAILSHKHNDCHCDLVYTGHQSDMVIKTDVADVEID